MAKKIDSLNELLKKKADEIDSSGVKDDVQLIQEELDRSFKKQVTLDKLQDNGVAVVKTRSSSMASEVRLKQHSIIQNLKQTTKNKLTRFRIIIS